MRPLGLSLGLGVRANASVVPACSPPLLGLVLNLSLPIAHRTNPKPRKAGNRKQDPREEQPAYAYGVQVTPHKRDPGTTSTSLPNGQGKLLRFTSTSVPNVLREWTG